MDEEAVKEIAKILDKYAMAFEVDGRYSPTPWAKEIVELLPKLGYRKPKEKPLLLGGEELEFGSATYDYNSGKTTVKCADCQSTLMVISGRIDLVEMLYPLICCGKVRLF